MILNKIKIFFRKTQVVIPTIVSMLINVIIWVVIYRVIDFKKTLHVLHYNFYFGIDYLSSPKYIFFIPLLGILIILVNTFFAYGYSQKKELYTLPYFLLFSNIFFNAMLLFYLLKIISIEY